MRSSSSRGRAVLLALVLALAGGIGGLSVWLLAGGPGEGVRREGALVPDARRGAAIGRAQGDALEAASFVPSSEPLAGVERDRSLRAVAAGAQSISARLAGAVRAWSDGRPLGGARVRAFLGAEEARATSGADGRFELAWQGGGEPALEIEAEGFVTARVPPVEVGRHLEHGAPAENGPEGFAGRGAAEPWLVVPLVEAASIEGIVIGPPPAGEGAPIVRLYSRERRGRASGELVAAVGADGSFRFGGLEAGEYLLAAEAPERALEIATRTLEPGERAHVRLELARAGRLSGLVLDGHGRGVADARVRIETERQGADSTVLAASRRETHTGPDGRYVLAGLSPGQNSVEVLAPWGERARAEVAIARAGELVERDFRMSPPAALSGLVLDAAGEPVRGALVEVSWNRRSPSLLGERDAGDGDDDTASSRAARSDELGRFRFEALPAGQPLAVAALDGEGGGHVAFELGLSLPEGSEHAGLELVLGAPLSLAGTVRMEGGPPLAGAEVELSSRLPGRWRPIRARTETDAAGRFAFGSLPPARYVVSASHRDARSGTLALDLEAPREELLIELEGAARISGVVLDEDGIAVSSARVLATRAGGAPAPGSGSRAGGDRPERHFVRADIYGRFEIGELAPGLFELVPFATGHQALGSPVAAQVPDEAPFVLYMRRDPPPASAGVRGVVRLMESREPPLGFSVGGARGGLLAYEDGRFRLEGLSPGVHRLELSAEGCVPLSVGPLELAPGDDLDLGTLEFLPGTLLTVDVRDPDGQRLRRARVVLVPPRPARGERAPVRLAERGRGRYEAMAPRGTWNVMVHRSGHRPETRRLEVHPRPTQRIEVVLEPE